MLKEGAFVVVANSELGDQVSFVIHLGFYGHPLSLGGSGRHILKMSPRLVTLGALVSLSLLLSAITYSSMLLYDPSHLNAPVTVDFLSEDHKLNFRMRHDVNMDAASQIAEPVDNEWAPEIVESTSSSSNGRSPLPADDFEFHTPTENVAISHVFSPYVWNDEFRIVSQSWRIAADKARQQGINVELICAVLPEDAKIIPPWARPVILTQKIENYRNKANALPAYGELFRVLRDKAYGQFVMYSNADIAVVPDFYIKVHEMMSQDLRPRELQKQMLERARSKFYPRCKHLTVTSSVESKTGLRQEVMCARDAVVYFENLGGRPPHAVSELLRFFRNASVTADEAIDAAYDASIPDPRTDGNAMTITRRQFPKAEASKVIKELFTADRRDIVPEVLSRLYEKEGEPHPGNDVFIMPKAAIPRLLTDTPFIHLRPSGFLIGQHLKDQPNLVWRRIVSAPDTRLTFHVGMGTDEWPTRAELQPRAVLFEVAHFFTRTNSTKESFWPPPHCENPGNYREYGTGNFCPKVPGDSCRGSVRLACTQYWHQGSRDRHALNTICYQVSGKGRTLDTPMCEFCNVSLSSPNCSVLFE